MNASSVSLSVPAHSNSLLDSLNQQRLSGTFCDVTIQVENHAFAMHRCVLAASSPLLNSFLCGSSDECSNRLSVLENVSAVGFGKIVDFLYSGTIELDDNNIHTILTVTKCLEMRTLEEKITSYLAQCKETSHQSYEFRQRTSDVTSAEEMIVDAVGIETVDSHVLPIDGSANQITHDPSEDVSLQSTSHVSKEMEQLMVGQSDTTAVTIGDDQDTSVIDYNKNDNQVDMSTTPEEKGTGDHLQTLSECSNSQLSSCDKESENVISKEEFHIEKERPSKTHSVSASSDEAGNREEVHLPHPSSPEVSVERTVTENVSEEGNVLADEKHGKDNESSRYDNQMPSSHTHATDSEVADTKTAAGENKHDQAAPSAGTAVSSPPEKKSSISEVSAVKKMSLNESPSVKPKGKTDASPKNRHKNCDISPRKAPEINTVSYHSMKTRSKRKHIFGKDDAKIKTKVTKMPMNSKIVSKTIKNKSQKISVKFKTSKQKLNDNKMSENSCKDSKMGDECIDLNRRARRKRKIMDDCFVYDLPKIRTSKRRRKNSKAGEEEAQESEDAEKEESGSDWEEQNEKNEEEPSSDSEEEKQIDDKSKLSSVFTCSECDQTFHKKSHLLFHEKTHLTNREFACEHCAMRFTVKQNLTRHIMRMHTDSRPFECGSCGKTFKANVDLQFHINCKHSVDNNYKCLECNVTFRTYSLLRLHQRSHKNKVTECEHCKTTFSVKSGLMQHECSEPLVCSYCGDSFTKYGQWLRHTQHHSRKGEDKKEDNVVSKLVCTVCTEEFSLKGDLLMHMKSHKGFKPFTCNTCCQQFSNENYLKLHEKTHIVGEKPYACSLCPARFMMKSNLRRHVNTLHHKVKPFKCQHCTKTFADTATMKCHMLKHTGERPHKCPTCFKSFSTTSNLNVHLKQHGSAKPFKCDYCGMAFTMKSLLNTHKKQHITPEMTTCKICSKVFPDVKRYKEHMRRHQYGIRPYVCEICGNQFTSPNGLMYHMMIHKGEKPHACDICHKRFRNITSLSSHQKTHTGEKTVMCEVCGEWFASKPSLRSHSRIHMTEKMFSCDKCSQKFHFQYDLKRHMLCHSDTKPFVCVLCNKALKQRTHLIRHWSTHLGHRAFSCNWCREKFLTTTDLLSHIQEDHNQTEEEAQKIVETEEQRAKATFKENKRPSNVDKSKYIAYTVPIDTYPETLPMQATETYVDVPAQVLECVQSLDEKAVQSHQVLADLSAYEELSEAQQIISANQFDPSQVQVHIAESIEDLQDGETYVFVKLESVDVVIPDTEEPKIVTM